MSEIRRQTAYKCSIQQLLNANYIQQQGLNPNYLDLNGIKASRLNILGILIAKDGNSLTLDDGTEKLQVMLFDDYQKKQQINLGEILLLIGKPREYNNKRFFVPEIIKKLNDPKWLEYRKRELETLEHCTEIPKKTQPPREEPINMNETIHEFENYQAKIIKKIQELDKGEGAPYQELIKQLKDKEAEKQIQELIKEGEIYEIKGKLKIL